MTDLIRFSLPQYQQEGKAYLNIAIGCTGGKHRSVVLAEDWRGRWRRRVSHPHPPSRRRARTGAIRSGTERGCGRRARSGDNTMNALRSALKWLYPGMRVKRWIALGTVGFALFLLGVGIRLQNPPPGEEPWLDRASLWIVSNIYIGVTPPIFGMLLVGSGVLLTVFASAN
jgi:hypothetical protein